MSKSDAIASAVLDEFEKLAANRKPAVRDNGVREWVPLCGIVAELEDGQLKCLALATGMKCLPASKLPLANGVGIHDWHAEILALRAFNRFVLQECHGILTTGKSSEFLSVCWQETTTDGALAWEEHPFTWNDNVSLHMYCSEAPCGDSSMELTMAAQDDASPWAAPSASEPGSRSVLAGRGYFSQLGTVRRKPGRGDSPPTLSKSCSDKLALRQCMSVLGGLSSLLVAPSPGLYLRSLVLPSSQYSETGCRRCFSAEEGRMCAVKDSSWPGGYIFAPFDVHTTDLEFSFSRRSVSKSSASSNLSVVWICQGVNECLVNGVLRGRKAFALAGASSVSRRRMWKLVNEIIRTMAAQGSLSTDLQQLLDVTNYRSVKSSSLLTSRNHVKKAATDVALRGWMLNTGDDEWGLADE